MSPPKRGAPTAPSAVLTSAPDTTARPPSKPELRATRRASFSRLLSRVLSSEDVTQAEAATATGISASIMQRICDRDARETLPHCDVEALPESVAVAILQDSASRVGRGYSVREQHQHDTVIDDLRHLAELNAEWAGLQAEILGALDDERITASEALKLIEIINEISERLDSLKARLTEALRDRVSAVRRGGSKPS
jgi:hypothetical protein